MSNDQINIYLQETPMLNYSCKTIQDIVTSHSWQSLSTYDQIKEIYSYVQNDIIFGYNHSDTLTAEEVIQDGYGQCNTKATLLMALLRSVGIPCRLHGLEVSKQFQRGATNAIISFFAPSTIVHTWAEVFYQQKWIALEGVITDKKYFESVKAQYPNEHLFQKYAIATEDLTNLSIDWQGTDTFVQSTAVVKDYGTFPSPDEFFSQHSQHWSSFKNWMYVHVGTKMMNDNVFRMRSQLR